MSLARLSLDTQREMNRPWPSSSSCASRACPCCREREREREYVGRSRPTERNLRAWEEAQTHSSGDASAPGAVVTAARAPAHPPRRGPRAPEVSHGTWAQAATPPQSAPPAKAWDDTFMTNDPRDGRRLFFIFFSSEFLFRPRFSARQFSARQRTRFEFGQRVCEWCCERADSPG